MLEGSFIRFNKYSVALWTLFVSFLHNSPNIFRRVSSVILEDMVNAITEKKRESENRLDFVNF